MCCWEEEHPAEPGLPSELAALGLARGRPYSSVLPFLIPLVSGSAKEPQQPETAGVNSLSLSETARTHIPAGTLYLQPGKHTPD